MINISQLCKTLFSDDNSEFKDNSVAYIFREKYRKHYMDAQEFNELVIDYINDRIRNNEILTDIDNSISIINAVNAIYLDIDFKFSDNVETNESRKNINDYLCKTFLEAFKNSYNKDFYNFVFVCDKFLNNKNK